MYCFTSTKLYKFGVSQKVTMWDTFSSPYVFLILRTILKNESTSLMVQTEVPRLKPVSPDGQT